MEKAVFRKTMISSAMCSDIKNDWCEFSKAGKKRIGTWCNDPFECHSN